MRELPLTKGAVAVVDDVDWPRVRTHKWFCLSGYAARQVRAGYCRQAALYLHRFLLDAGPGQVVVHVNGDKLDNRRANLMFREDYQRMRAAEHARMLEERRRTTPPSRQGIPNHQNRTGYVGVTPYAGGYRSRLRLDGTVHDLGFHLTAEEAAAAYDMAALTLIGPHARLNFAGPGERSAVTFARALERRVLVL